MQQQRAAQPSACKVGYHAVKEQGLRSQYRKEAMDCTARGSAPSWENRLIGSSKRPHLL